MTEIILFQPEIPQNTGNIARTCAATGSSLTLVRPLGFSLSSRWVKRAGLDYLDKVEIKLVDSLEAYLQEKETFYFFSTKAKIPYSEIRFNHEAALIFGSESAGLPSSIHTRWPDRFYTIPMRPSIRSLNLSNAASIVLYEALKQNGFAL
ncbi:MAG: tRNA (cytidine(34)-2'-O)-methyltransferase [Chlamydiales bacterium]